jgi:hypothetical protein
VSTAYQDERQGETDLGPGPSARIGVMLANLWPETMVALALGLTVAWTGLLMSLVWWGIEGLM